MALSALPFIVLRNPFATPLLYTVSYQQFFNAFFIVEAKCAESLIEDAENQCCRGGAAVVYARLQFIAKVNDKGELASATDLDSIAFSLALISSIAHLFIHWALVSEKDTSFTSTKGYEMMVGYHMKWVAPTSGPLTVMIFRGSGMISRTFLIEAFQRGLIMIIVGQIKATCTRVAMQK